MDMSETAICASRRDRVFCETEIPNLCDRDAYPAEALSLVLELLDNKDIETINGVPMAVYRALYKRWG